MYKRWKFQHVFACTSLASHMARVKNWDSIPRSAVPEPEDTMCLDLQHGIHTKITHDPLTCSLESGSPIWYPINPEHPRDMPCIHLVTTCFAIINQEAHSIQAALSLASRLWSAHASPPETYCSTGFVQQDAIGWDVWIQSCYLLPRRLWWHCSFLPWLSWFSITLCNKSPKARFHYHFGDVNQSVLPLSSWWIL